MSRCVGVVGSRDFPNEELVSKWLGTFLEPGDIVVTGGARGVDTWAEEYAHTHGFKVRVHRPEWTKYGKGAGFIRNAEIIRDADVLVAFWDGKSRGTKNSIEQAGAKGIPIRVVSPDAHS